ncbi:hypothetical protein K504DRAFT_506544 [Pleomassaria siparia CBS 279.74]|uniref:Uncharacterized protein n=1 Tax=Pleomassaria siparia CBS 279.74 TaxID=1314801 RepID=A0A6G1JWU1_9PLEO|nr:hypothetical protein K504DRAFT_506544 [Pleomassaria siparia CBS 279.74]
MVISYAIRGHLDRKLGRQQAGDPYLSKENIGKHAFCTKIPKGMRMHDVLDCMSKIHENNDQGDYGACLRHDNSPGKSGLSCLSLNEWLCFMCLFWLSAQNTITTKKWFSSWGRVKKVDENVTRENPKNDGGTRSHPPLFQSSCRFETLEIRETGCFGVRGPPLCENKHLMALDLDLSTSSNWTG